MLETEADPTPDVRSETGGGGGWRPRRSGW